MYNKISGKIIKGFTVNEWLGHFLSIPCVSEFKLPVGTRPLGYNPGDNGYLDFSPSLMFRMWWENLIGVCKYLD